MVLIIPLTRFELVFSNSKPSERVFELAVSFAPSSFIRDCLSVFPGRLDVRTDALFVVSTFQRADAELVDWSNDAAVAKDLLLDSVRDIDVEACLIPFFSFSDRDSSLL